MRIPAGNLERRGVALPEGKVRPFKGNYLLGPMTDTHVLFLRKGHALRAGSGGAGIYPNLMLAHKGKAGWWFTALGYGAALSLIILYVTGILLMWKNRGKRKLMLGQRLLGNSRCGGGVSDALRRGMTAGCPEWQSLHLDRNALFQ